MCLLTSILPPVFSCLTRASLACKVPTCLLMWWNKLVTRVTLTTRTNFWIWYHIKKNKTGKVLIRILIFTICKLWPSPFPVSSFSYFSWHWYLTKLLQKFSRVPSFRLPFWGAIFAVFLPESCLKFGSEESANSSNFQFHRIFGGRVRFWLTFEILKLFEMAGLMFTNFLLGWHSQCQRGRERLRYWFVCNCAENQNKLSWKQRKLQ